MAEMRLAASDGTIAIFTFQSDGGVIMMLEGKDDEITHTFDTQEEFYFDYLPNVLYRLSEAGLTYTVTG